MVRNLSKCAGPNFQPSVERLGAERLDDRSIADETVRLVFVEPGNKLRD
jgi:hypothetical protein